MNGTLKKNQLVEVTIEDLGSNGEGVGKYEGYTLFIKNAVVGDQLLVKILKTGKNYGFARVEEVIEPSPFRVEPRCPIADKCGGCQIQQLDYKKQLEFKENKVLNALQRIGGFKNLKIDQIHGMEDPYYYRNKAQIPVGSNKAGEVIMGFYAKGTHSIIDTDHCYIGAKVNIEITKIIKEFVKEYDIIPYDEANHKGLLRHVLTRVGFNTDEVMVCLVINARRLPYQDELVKMLEDVPGIKSICINVNRENTNVVLGEKIIPIWGEPYITDTIGDIKYRISPLSFYQVNPVQTKKLYDMALEYADLKGNEVVWDLYCGIGTISLYLAKHAKKVFGVEINPDAVEDAKMNAKINGIENAEFFTGAVEDVLPAKYEEDHIQADVVVIDPPRKGCDERLLETIISMKPKRVVYVSCDPATLARDVKHLAENGYRLEKVGVVDQFCHTVHVESIILMTYCGSEGKK